MVKRKIIPYNPHLKALARVLRSNMTFSEVLLWNELKNKGLLGYDFDRQRPIGNYIVDFYCKELSLAIEIDGDSHLFRDEEDEKRQIDLEKLGVKFLRFDDSEIKKSMNNVLRVIADWTEKNKPTPNPSREGNKTTIPVTCNLQPEEPTPSPSREGNKTTKPVTCNLQPEEPTPSPSREGNKTTKPATCNLQGEKPTPSPPTSWGRHSREGNKPTPSPSREGNKSSGNVKFRT